MRTIVAVLLVAMLLLAGCTQPATETLTPGPTRTRASSSTQAGDSLVVESISPSPGTRLTPGQTVQVTALVSYTLSSMPEAEIFLLYQAEPGRFIVFAKKGVVKGTGQVTLEGQFQAPDMENVGIRAFFVKDQDNRKVNLVYLDVTVYGPGGMAVAAPRPSPGTPAAITRSPTVAATPTPTAELTFRPKPLPPGTVDPAASAWPVAGHDGRHTRQGQYPGPRFWTERLWTFDKGKGFDFFAGSPVIGPDGTIYAGAKDAYLYAINPDGSLKWKFQTRGDIESSAAVRSDATVYVSSAVTEYISPTEKRYHGGSYLYAISPDGTLDWEFNAHSSSIRSPVIGPDGTVYFYADTLYAVNYDGTLRWKFDLAGGSPRRPPSFNTSPAIGGDGTIYLGTGWSLFAVSNDGEKEWELLIGEKKSVGNEYTPAIGPEGTIYVGSNDGHLHAVSSNGTLKWRSAMKVSLNAFVAVSSDGTLYVVSEEGYLHALNPDGSLKWKRESDKNNHDSPVVDSEGVVYWNGFGMRGDDGATISRLFLGGVIGRDRNMYAASGNTLYALGPARGPRIALAKRQKVTVISGEDKGSSSDWGWVRKDEFGFPTTGVGSSSTSILTVINYGDEPARVEGITASLPDFVASPSTFTVPPQSSREVTVTFKPSWTEDRMSGDTKQRKEATLTIASNDPDAPQRTAKLTGMAAIPVAKISTYEHDFGLVPVGQSGTMTLTVSNSGIVPLSVTGIVPTSPDFETFPASFTIAPESSQDVTVTFRPSRAGGRWDKLAITTNDPRNPTRLVSLSANWQQLWLLPDFTMSESPYEGELEPVGIGYNQAAEWTYILPDNLRTPSYLVSLKAAARQPDSGEFKLELVLDVKGSQTVLASTRMTVVGARLVMAAPGPYLPPQPVGWSTEPSQAIVALKGVAPSASEGGSLILRVTNLAQGLGIIELEKLAPNYLAISSN